MSEPMSSVEIEDVLSSIRRLVSDEMRPQPRTAQAAPVEARAPQPAAAADKLLLTPALRIVPDAEPEVAVPAFHSVRVQPEEEAGFIAVEDEDEVARASVVPLADYYEDEEAAPVAEAASPIPDEVFATTEAVAEPEAAPDAVDNAGLDWADAAEAAVRAELEEEIGEASYAHILDDAPEAAAGVMDEEALRELVRDIIREELQGTLGERITRNVRKLVRAEVARALAVRDFE